MMDPEELIKKTRRFLIAHRGNLAGPSAHENTVSYLVDALNHGFSVEIDLRDDNGNLYLSHDPGSFKPSNSWENFVAEVKKLVPLWDRDQPWDEAGFPVPRIWVDWKEAGVSIMSVLVDLVGVLGMEALRYFIFIDFELVYTAPVARRIAGLLGSQVSLGWRRSNLDDESEEHIKEALLLRDQSYNDWIWVDDLRDNLLTPWWALPPESKSLVFVEVSDQPGSALFVRKALVAPDLHKVSGPDSVAILAGLVQRCISSKTLWIDAVCSDYVSDPSLVDSMAALVKAKIKTNEAWAVEL